MANDRIWRTIAIKSCKRLQAGKRTIEIDKLEIATKSRKKIAFRVANDRDRWQITENKSRKRF